MKRHQARIGVGEIGGEQAKLPRRADILRIEHDAADLAIGELVAHGDDAGVALALAMEADHDHLADHAAEEIIVRRHLAQTGEAVGLGRHGKARTQAEGEHREQQAARCDRNALHGEVEATVIFNAYDTSIHGAPL